MRTLYVKILVWLLAAVALTTAAVLAMATLTFSGPRERQTPLALLASMQLRELRRAYETGGPSGYLAARARLSAASGIRGVLTDAAGKEVSTGEDYSRLLERAREHPWLPVRWGNWLAIDREAEDGRYWYFLLLPRRRWAFWFLRPGYLLVFALAGLLCWWLASYLTKPLRLLESAVERFGGGDLKARVGTYRNDELGRLARAFDRMAERVQELVLSQRRLLLDVSHEIRSPLTRLSVAAELARTSDNPEAALDQIEKEAGRLNALLGDLLQVTRAESEPAALPLEDFQLEELLEEIAGDVSLEARARGSEVELRASSPATVRADRELLRRAVENILRNAVRFAPPETSVEVGLEKVAAEAVIRVRDRGPGVPEECLPRLFEPFYRVEPDRSRSRGGAGLGLAIARRAVELSGGRIAARNAQPGLEVEIRLPCKA